MISKDIPKDGEGSNIFRSNKNAYEEDFFKLLILCQFFRNQPYTAQLCSCAFVLFWKNYFNHMRTQIERILFKEVISVTWYWTIRDFN